MESSVEQTFPVRVFKVKLPRIERNYGGELMEQTVMRVTPNVEAKRYKGRSIWQTLSSSLGVSE